MILDSIHINVFIASYDLFPAGYAEATGTEFHRQIVARLSTLPGVQSVALSTRVPLSFTGGSTAVKPEGYVSSPNESTETQVAIVTPNYLHTMQIPLVEGRDFAAQDTKETQPVAIVSEAFAKHYWPGREAPRQATQFRPDSPVVHRDRRRARLQKRALNEKRDAVLVFAGVADLPARNDRHVRTAGDPLASASRGAQGWRTPPRQRPWRCSSGLAGLRMIPLLSLVCAPGRRPCSMTLATPVASGCSSL